MKREPKPAKPLTKRQRELIVAVFYGEVFPGFPSAWARKQGYIHLYEHRDDGRDIDVTATIRKLQTMHLVRWSFVVIEGKPKSEWPKFITTTLRGEAIAVDACTDLP